MRVGEIMRCAGIDLQRRMLGDLRGGVRRSVNRHDLIVVSVHDQSGLVELLQIGGKVCCRELFDAVVSILVTCCIPWSQKLSIIPWLTWAPCGLAALHHPGTDVPRKAAPEPASAHEKLRSDLRSPTPDAR